MSESNLFEQQRRNRRRSAVLVALFLLFFAWIGFGGDLGFYLNNAGAEPGTYRHSIPWFGIVMTGFGIVMVMVAWRRGPKQVLWATGAWELLDPSTPQEKQLVNVVEEMAIASGLRRPKIWIVPEKDPNAFATGIDENDAHVAVTEGLLEALNRDQLQGVIAHEMAHIQNYDVKLMTLLAALVGAIAIMSDGMARMMRFGGGRRGSGSSGGKKGGNPIALVILVLWIVSIIFAPIISRFLALAVSRKREFLADATAAQFTRNPEALASALRTIEDHHAPTTVIKRGTAHLCIADPLGRRLTNKQGFVADLLATHPPMGMRVSRLNAMAFKFKKTGELTGDV